MEIVTKDRFDQLVEKAKEEYNAEKELLIKDAIKRQLKSIEDSQIATEQKKKHLDALFDQINDPKFPFDPYNTRC